MSSPKLGRPKLRLWPAFVWAAFPPILLIGLGALLTLNGDPPAIHPLSSWFYCW
jgi:hypothetical protein